MILDMMPYSLPKNPQKYNLWAWWTMKISFNKWATLLLYYRIVCWSIALIHSGKCIARVELCWCLFNINSFKPIKDKDRTASVPLIFFMPLSQRDTVPVNVIVQKKISSYNFLYFANVMIHDGAKYFNTISMGSHAKLSPQSFTGTL